MDFDHVRGQKSFGLSKAYRIATPNRTLEEIQKCDLVCANCHRRRTQKRMPVREKEGNLAKITKFVQAQKDNRPCSDCGVIYEYFIMDFDHREIKSINLSLAARKHWGERRVQQEIDRCDLVCANCHRIRTLNRPEKSQFVPTERTNRKRSDLPDLRCSKCDKTRQEAEFYKGKTVCKRCQIIELIIRT